VARRVVISGRVQGVWFRESCRREALAHGVTGWVRNLDDGRVEAWLEGNVTAVHSMAAWCHQGPPRALVTGVVEQERVSVGHATFEVR
jgi:acylphosphatase